MIRKHQLPRVFPENVLAEARAVAHLDQAEVAQPPRFSRAADRHHRRRDGARLRRCGAGDRARRRRLRAAGAYCRCGRVCARGDGPGPGSAAARNQRLLSRSRHSHAAAGAFDRHLQPAPRRRPAGAELHHAARCSRPHRELRDCRGRDPLGGADDLHRGPRDSGGRCGDARARYARWFRSSSGCTSWPC